MKAKLQELKRQSSDASVKWPRKVDEYVKLGQRQRQMRAARGFGRARPPTPEEQELTEQISALQKEVRELERQKDAILVPKRSMTHSRETAEKRIAMDEGSKTANKVEKKVKTGMFTRRGCPIFVVGATVPGAVSHRLFGVTIGFLTPRFHALRGNALAATLCVAWSVRSVGKKQGPKTQDTTHAVDRSTTSLVSGRFRRIACGEVGKVVVGQPEVIDGMLTALVAGGHVLIEGNPGLGKTVLVRTLAQVVELSFQRVQFTPDLMPSDLLGTYVVMETPQGRRTFEFQKGPIFSHLILADQINRGTPKTQSALLEAMEGREKSPSPTRVSGCPSLFALWRRKTHWKWKVHFRCRSRNWTDSC